MSWNLHLGVTTEGDRYAPTSAIDHLDADVLLAQEVWWADCGPDPLAHWRDRSIAIETLPLVRASLRGGTVEITPSGQAGEGWWGLAILSRAPIIARAVIDLGRMPSDRIRRRALWARVDLGDRHLDVVNAHLTHRVPLGMIQLRALGAVVDATGPVVIGGDLNLWGPVVDRVLPRWQRPVRQRTFPAHRPIAGIDHLLCSPSVQILAAERPTIDHGSDHHPVAVTVAIPVARTGQH